MTDWQQRLTKIASGIETQVDALMKRVFKSSKHDKPLYIQPYIGYATQEKIFLRGRVLQDNGITSAEESDSIWENLRNMVRRFNSHEIPGATLRARFGQIEQDCITDEEGYFHLELDLTMPASQQWVEVDLELLDQPGQGKPPEPVIATGRVLVPPAEAQFAVISDIDDTVLQTDALNYLKMARNVFLRNARTRLPFEGVAAFYQALQQGTTASFNPIFYLSKSPWNLFDLLLDFFEVRRIPLGPFFLTDLGISLDKLLTPRTREYKLGAIQLLLRTYPDLVFILIGDSGEKDADIYVEVAETHPGRILAIYIRDVTGPWRDAALDKLRDRAQQARTEMLLVEDTGVAAAHAVERGFILSESYPQVIAERDQDQKAPRPLQELFDPQADD